MRNKQSRAELMNMTDALAEAVRKRSTQQTIEAAEELKQMAGTEADPFTDRLLAETLEDFSRLPDYTEALFRRRAERVIRPRRRFVNVIISRARQVKKFLLLPAGSKRSVDNER